MKNFIFAIIVFTAFNGQSQDCYSPSTAYSTSDFSNLWLNKTFQGTIGKSNQRIEVRFLNILQDVNSKLKYRVSGKSKVNNNICDFIATIELKQVYELNTNNLECEGPSFPSGYVVGSYSMNEDSTQNHVGTFNGTFKSKFVKSDGYIKKFKGWYKSHGVNEFIGSWKEYGNSKSKYCAWGLKIPPTKNDDLFKPYDNEFYLFNPKFLDKGWKNYVIANLNTFLTIPVDFETEEARFSKDFDKSFSNDDINKARETERIEWWK
jgi:hypothetical protein